MNLCLDMAVENFKTEYRKRKIVKTYMSKLTEKERIIQEEKYEREWAYWKTRNSHKRGR